VSGFFRGLVEHYGRSNLLLNCPKYNQGAKNINYINHQQHIVDFNVHKYQPLFAFKKTKQKKRVIENIVGISQQLEHQFL
jgi:hypothetical protein